LPASSSESAFDVGAAVKMKRKKRRQHTFDDVVPALADDVTKLLESQVGRFTHALCAPLSDVPAYFEPASASKSAPLVKSEPCDQDHVLCVGTTLERMSKLLREFRNLRSKKPDVNGTFVVPYSPNATWWRLLPPNRLCEFVPDVKLFARGATARRVYGVYYSPRR
jgi:hypothetical protein